MPHQGRGLQSIFIVIGITEILAHENGHAEIT